jgi:hypothetical protein
MDSPQPRFVVSTPSGSADPDEDLDEPLYTPFRGWFEAKPGRPVLAAAVALILLQALVRGYVKFGSWFIGDDLAFIGRAERLPFWSPEYLLAGWNGHFMPGAFAYVRLLTALWPLNYVPVGVGDLLLQALAGLLMYALLTSLFGARPAILVPLAVFLFSPMTLPAFVWWAAALNQLFGQIAMILVLLLHVRYHRTGRVRYGVLGALSLLVGLAFSEKLLLTVPVVCALTLFYFTGGPPLLRVRRAVGQHARVWVAYAAVVVPYLAYYTTHVKSPIDARRNLTLTLDTLGTALGHAVLPALFGGPWRWMPIGVQGGIANPGTAMVTVVAVASALVVWASVVRRRRAIFAWVVIATYTLVNAVILGVTRGPWVGPIIGAEYRYSTDACVIFAIFGALAFLPLHGHFAGGQPQRLVTRRVGRRVQTEAPAPSALQGPGESAVASGLAIAVLVSSMVSTFAYDHLWRNDNIRNFFTTTQRDYANVKRGVTLADTNFPENIQSGLFGEWGRTSALFAAFRPRPEFLTPGRYASDLLLTDDSGHLRLATVEGFTNVPGSVKGCGYRIEDALVSIKLGATTLPWLWYVRIGYIASDDATTTVRAGRTVTSAKVHRGLGNLFVMGDGAIGTVELSGLSAGALCTDDVAVGFLKAVPGTHP